MYEVRRTTAGAMAWNRAGTDIGKAHHHTVVLNNDGVLTPEGELTAELRVMTDRRANLVKERTRKANRLHARVLSIFPAWSMPWN